MALVYNNGVTAFWCSDDMFVEWNTAYIHVLLDNVRQGGGGTPTVFMRCGMNTEKIWIL